MRLFCSVIPFAFAASLGATSLSASSVLTFEGGTYVFDEASLPIEYFEDEFHVSGGVIEDGNLHSHSSFSNTITLSDGSNFNAESVDLDPAISGYRFEDSTTHDFYMMCGTLCLDVSITGYRDGVEVANLIVSSAVDLDTFGTAFNGIDALEIEWRNFFSDQSILDMEAQGYDFIYEDNQLNYDNLTVSAVPIPATGLLLVAGLFGLGALARRRR